MSYATSCPACGSTRCATIADLTARCKGPTVCVDVGCERPRFDGSTQCEEHYPHTRAYRPPFVAESVASGVAAEAIKLDDATRETASTRVIEAPASEEMVPRALLDDAVRSREHTVYWYAVRLERLKDMAKERGFWPEMACIIANGTGDIHEPPTYAQQLNRATHHAEAAEKERDEARHDYRVVEAAIRTLGFPVVEAPACVKAIQTLARERDEARAERDQLAAEMAEARKTVEALRADYGEVAGPRVGVVEDVANTVHILEHERDRAREGRNAAEAERDALTKQVAALRGTLTKCHEAMSQHRAYAGQQAAFDDTVAALADTAAVAASYVHVDCQEIRDLVDEAVDAGEAFIDGQESTLEIAARLIGDFKATVATNHDFHEKARSA